MHTAKRLLLMTLPGMVIGCVEPETEPSDEHPVRDLDEIDSGAPLIDPGDTGLGTILADDARISGTDFPPTMSCGEVLDVAIQVQNMGSEIWTRTEGYKLGAVEDLDPFYTRDTRVWLPDDVTVLPGEMWTFEFELEAPEASGDYVTDWQMVHEQVQWFGEQAVQLIEVECDETVDEPDNEVPSGPPDLNDVVWLHTNVTDWAETATLSSVSFSGDSICLDYDKANEWPVTDYSGVDVVGNPWVFIWQDETWYAGTWEWLRPGQTCKSVDAVAASHIKQDPFPESSSWVPTSGQSYWFMVSGLARSTLRNAEERTNLVEVIWP